MRFTKIDRQNLYISCVNFNILDELWDTINPTNARKQPLDKDKKAYPKEVFRELLGYNSPAGRNTLSAIINGNPSIKEKIDTDIIKEKLNIEGDYLLGEKLFRIDTHLNTIKDREELIKMIVEPVRIAYEMHSELLKPKGKDIKLIEDFCQSDFTSDDCLGLSSNLQNFFNCFNNTPEFRYFCLDCIKIFRLGRSNIEVINKKQADDPVIDSENVQTYVEQFGSSNKKKCFLGRIAQDIYSYTTYRDYTLNKVVYVFKNNKPLNDKIEISNCYETLQSIDYDSMSCEELEMPLRETASLLNKIQIIYNYKKLKNE